MNCCATQFFKKVTLKSAILLAFSIFVIAHFSSCFSSTTSPIIAQFFGIWLDSGQTWQQKFRSDTPFTKLNRLYIAFGKIVQTSDGHFTLAFDGSSDYVAQLIQRMRTVNPHAQLLLTVGGNGTVSSYGGAANDPQFASNVLNFLNTYGFNGFDVDWEGSLDQQGLDHLMQNLYQTLHANHDVLTLDVWPLWSSVYDINVLKNNLDQINIMSYGANLPLDVCANSFAKAGFPMDKMVGGIETEAGYNGGNEDTLGENGTIVQKSSYALSHGMAGMMEWRLDADYPGSLDPNYPTYKGALQLWSSMTTPGAGVVAVGHDGR